jgi:hypothetical protein
MTERLDDNTPNLDPAHKLREATGKIADARFKVIETLYGGIEQMAEAISREEDQSDQLLRLLDDKHVDLADDETGYIRTTSSLLGKAIDSYGRSPGGALEGFLVDTESAYAGGVTLSAPAKDGSKLFIDVQERDGDIIQSWRISEQGASASEASPITATDTLDQEGMVAALEACGEQWQSLAETPPILMKARLLTQYEQE